MKAIQYFNDEILETCRQFSVKEILEFLKNFQTLSQSSKKVKTKAISIKIEEDLLQLFRQKAKLENQPYQTKIKDLMRKYCLNEPLN